MLATQAVIKTMADRIEQAYRLRRPRWRGTWSTSGVWAVAAAKLLEVHEDDRSIPPDPELYVAAQPAASKYPDPWVELTQAGCVRRFRRRVREMVRALRNELSAEVKLAEGRVGAGRSIGKVLNAPSRRLSPLGRYIVARRAGRVALAQRFLPGAVQQHRACPLYRQAAKGLLPDESYPSTESVEAASASLHHDDVRSRSHAYRN